MVNSVIAFPTKFHQLILAVQTASLSDQCLWQNYWFHSSPHYYLQSKKCSFKQTISILETWIRVRCTPLKYVQVLQDLIKQWPLHNGFWETVEFGLLSAFGGVSEMGRTMSVCPIIHGEMWTSEDPALLPQLPLRWVY